MTRICLRPWLIGALLLMFSVAWLPTQTSAQIITDIAVEGTSDVESTQIIFSLESQVGLRLNKQQIIEDIHRIYDMGLFTDVRVQAEQNGDDFVLTFIVKERPRINTVFYEGRTLISKDTLNETITVKASDVYDEFRVNENIKLIQDLYRSKGYTQIKVTSRIKELENGDLDVTFVIDETPRVYLANINVHGTEVFSELEIKRFITSQEIDCMAWFGSSGIFQEERVNQDMALITQNYLKNGYIKVFIEKPEVILWHNPDFSHIEVTLNITENDQYFTGEVSVSGDILGEEQDMLDMLKLIKGEPYNPFLQNEDRAVINELYQEQGYAFVRVIPRTKIHEDTKTVDVNYHIIKNEKAYLGRIKISGNTTTRDYVVRRDFEVVEGELYNGKKLRVSQANLARTGFFEPGINLEEERREEEDNILDILTRIKEGKTGSINAQVGYSEFSKLQGGLSLSKGNLFGRGWTLRLNAQFAQEGVTNDFSITFIEPRLLNTQTSVSVSVAQRHRSDISERDRGEIEENSYSFSIGRPVYRKVRYRLSFNAIDRLFNEQGISSVIKRSMTHTLSYNTVNHPVFPSSGLDTSFSVTQTGGTTLGGNTQFREYNYSYQQFWPLNDNNTVIVMAQARLGFLEEIGENEIPSEDRYRIGGINTVRGFNLRSIAGPFAGGEALQHQEVRTVITESGVRQSDLIDNRTRNLTYEEILELEGGGISQRIFNLELLFPVTFEEQSNIRMVLFYDAGNINAEQQQYDLLDENPPDFFQLRTAIGAGFRIITPMGVLRFEYGQKLDRLPEEDPDKFDFSISGLF